MAREARVTVSLSIRKLSDDGVPLVDHRPPAKSFVIDVDGAAGPTPGTLLIDEDGRDIVFSELDVPGLCQFTNQDDLTTIRIGIRDPDTNLFYPFMKLAPGESYIVYLDETLGQEQLGTGTGTGVVTNFLHARGVLGSANLLIEAFEA